MEFQESDGVMDEMNPFVGCFDDQSCRKQSHCGLSIVL